MNNIVYRQEILWQIKAWKLNFAIIPFYITISLTSHIIAMRLSIAFGYPIISAAWIYMSIFIFNDVVRTYSKSRYMVYIFIGVEALCNLLSFAYCTFIINSGHPSYANNIPAYNVVFGSIWNIYLANLIGSAIAAIIDVWLFSYLFFKRKWFFFLASIVSSLITLIAYTIITDYFGLRGVFPNNIWEITAVNVITNIIMLVIYGVLGQIFVLWIHNKYFTNI